MSKRCLESYKSLIKDFIDYKIAVSDFVEKYMDMLLGDPDDTVDNAFLVLDELFANVDAYEPDPSLRQRDSLDENQLRSAASKAYDEMLEEEEKKTR